MTRTVSMEAPLSSNAMVPGSYAPPNLEPLPLPPPAAGSAPPADSQSATSAVATGGMAAPDGAPLPPLPAPAPDATSPEAV